MTDAQTEARAIARIETFLNNPYHSKQGDDREVQSGAFDEDTPITFGDLRAVVTTLAAKDAELATIRANHQRYVGRVTIAEAALTTERAALAEARKALEPFATVLDEYDPTEEDDETLGTFVAGSVTNYDLTLGDFRAARRALTGGKEDA